MTVKLDPALEQKLRQRSAALGKPASALIREALSRYLAETTATAPSAYALGADLFGRFGGPVDLAERRKAIATEVWNDRQQARSAKVRR